MLHTFMLQCCTSHCQSLERNSLLFIAIIIIGLKKKHTDIFSNFFPSCSDSTNDMFQNETRFSPISYQSGQSVEYETHLIRVREGQF